MSYDFDARCEIGRTHPCLKRVGHDGPCLPDPNRDPENGSEVEHLRKLLIDPGHPAWENARWVLVTELRKAGLNRIADDVAEGRGANLPSWIALNLIGQARRHTAAATPLRLKWNRAELMRAYDDVEMLRRDIAQPTESPLNESLVAVLDAIEAADCEWAEITRKEAA